MVHLGANQYGKAEVRLVHVARGAGPDGEDLLRDWNVSTSLSGDLADSHLTGSNAKVLPTDSQKNKAYALAKELGGDVEPEVFATALGSFFVSSQEPITRARVSVEEYEWSPIGATGYSFARSGELVRTTVVHVDSAAGTSVVSGLKDLTVLNTTASEFWGYPKDAYTTLPETKDRILATSVNASWRFRPDAVVAGVDWAAAFSQARSTVLLAFAGTYSYSLQQTLYAIGSAVITALPEVCEVRLALPNRHHYLVDLAPFGLSNEREVYQAGDRPYGLIEGTVLADDAPADEASPGASGRSTLVATWHSALVLLSGIGATAALSTAAVARQAADAPRFLLLSPAPGTFGKMADAGHTWVRSAVHHRRADGPLPAAWRACGAPRAAFLLLLAGSRARSRSRRIGKLIRCRSCRDHVRGVPG